MAEIENVKVAVRVRPFNSREKQRNAKLIVSMVGNQTMLRNPEDPDEEKKFAFDFSYWSHDGCKEESDGYFSPTSDKFADQKKVYKDLGVGVLTNAWGGYNSTLFAYGQTGSGKSWSMVGYGVNKGIVPMYAEEIFQKIGEEKAKGTATVYEVKFSMLEIYSEVCRDLLNAKSDKRRGLKIREHPKKGFYPEGLTTTLVDSYKAIEQKMEEGTTSRTIAATNMNATSSRAHTIVGITLVQKAKNAAGQETAKTSVVNLVDLAGSERVSSTGATGDRLKEGAAINQSLSALGNVIGALAEESEGKKVKIPYRDSVLTKLLQNALGGNSKTIMIAAISPADINFDESLSTLRYADRAKQIKTKAVVNEDPTEKLIRELKEENERLQKMMKKGGVVAGSVDGDSDEVKKEYEEKLKAEMEENDRELAELKQTYEEKLKAAQAASADVTNLKKDAEKNPHLSNLNPDPQLCGMIIHIIKGDMVKIGKTTGLDIQMLGPSIQPEHAVIKKTDKGEYSIARANGDARLLVNGAFVSEHVVLHHNDRVMLGTTQLYLYKNAKGKKKGKGKSEEEFTYEMAQDEMASSQGFNMEKDSNNNKDDYLLQEDLADMLPAIEEANSYSEELDKKVKFEISLMSAKARGLVSGRTEVWVRVKNMETGLEYMWPRQKFLNRKYVMQEMYQKHDDGEEWDLPDEKDPFTEPPDAEVQIGHVALYLESMAYLIEFKELVEVTDLKGREVGACNVELVPCDSKGKEYSEGDDIFVDDPKKLLKKDIHFYVKIIDAKGMPPRFTDIYGRYKVYVDVDYTQTDKIGGTSNPTFNHKKMFSFKNASKKEVEYLKKGFILIELWGKQKPPKEKLNKGKNTKQLLGADKFKKAAIASANNASIKTTDDQKMKTSMELALMKKRQQKLEQKLEHYKLVAESALMALEEILAHSQADDQQWDNGDASRAPPVNPHTTLNKAHQLLTDLGRGGGGHGTVGSNSVTPRPQWQDERVYENDRLPSSRVSSAGLSSARSRDSVRYPFSKNNCLISPSLSSSNYSYLSTYHPMHTMYPRYTPHYTSYIPWSVKRRHERYNPMNPRASYDMSSSRTTPRLFHSAREMQSEYNYYTKYRPSTNRYPSSVSRRIDIPRSHTSPAVSRPNTGNAGDRSDDLNLIHYPSTTDIYKNTDTKSYYNISSVTWPAAPKAVNKSTLSVSFPQPLARNSSTTKDYSTWEKYFMKSGKLP